MDHFELESVTLVGHSLGGDLGTLLCRQDFSHEGLPLVRRRIRGYLNVEGNLTENDLFISGQVEQTVKDDRFDEWFTQDFTYQQVYCDWCQHWLFGRRYLASLQFCDPAAFQQNATELYERNGPKASQPAGLFYRELSIPRLFVYGQKSLHPESRAFAYRNGLEVYEVVGSHHWPMIDCADEFYDVLFRFCQGEEIGGTIAE